MYILKEEAQKLQIFLRWLLWQQSLFKTEKFRQKKLA